jgi:hypothetical protein
MSATHADVLASLASWNLEGVVQCKEIKGKTEITYEGETQVFPHWLALRRVNQIGSDYVYQPKQNDC